MRIRQDGYQRELALLMYNMGVGGIQNEGLLINSPLSCILLNPCHGQVCVYDMGLGEYRMRDCL